MIDFRQVAAPNFNDSNELLRLAAESANKGMTGLKDTWSGAMGAVQNRNQADMQALINQQTAQDLNNPETVQNLLAQFKTMAEPTGGNYDPTVIQAALDGRQDTLKARQGVDYANADANLGVQQAGVNLTDSIVTNANKQTDYLKAAAAKQKETALQGAYGTISNYNRVTAGLDPNNPADIPKLELALAERDNYLKELFPKGSMTPDIQQKIYEMTQDRGFKVDINTENIEGKRISNKVTENADARNSAKFAWEVEKGNEAAAAKQLGARRDQATLAGINPNVINPDNSFNANAANQDLMTKITEAQRQANSPPNSVPFSERVNEHIGKQGEDAPISPAKLRQLQKALNNYAGQNSGNKSMRLDDDDRWAIYQGILSGKIQSEKWSVGEALGMSNYEGLFEEVIPQYMERRIRQDKPVNNNLIAAEQVGQYFKGLGGIGDQVVLAEQMGIVPNSPLFMYLPEPIRQKLDPNNTDNRRYTDVPTIKSSAAKIENNVKPKKKASGPKPASQRQYLLGR